MKKCVNLMPATKRIARRRLTQIRRVAMALAVWATVVVLSCAICLASMADDSENLGEEIAHSKSMITSTKSAITKLQGQISKTSIKLQANQSVGNQPDWSRLLGLISANLGENIVLRRCKLDATSEGQDRSSAGKIQLLTPQQASGRSGGFQLTIDGLAMDQAAMWAFVLKLEKMGLFDSVRMVRSSTEKFMDKTAISFTLALELGKSEGIGQ